MCLAAAAQPRATRVWPMAEKPVGDRWGGPDLRGCALACAYDNAVMCTALQPRRCGIHATSETSMYT
eukprot:3049464-Prymnesium_polylepis.1